MEKSKKRKIIKRVLLGFLVAFAIFAVGMHFFVTNRVKEMSNITVEFSSATTDHGDQQNLFNQVSFGNSEQDNQSMSNLAGISAFEEQDIFDDDAKNWSNMFDSFTAAGVLVFDANNDGLLDVYLCHSGANWTRPTVNAVIQDEPYHSFNGLYLNQGNDEEGNPIYKQACVLAGANDTYQKEELLVENLLFPRETAQDSTRRIGRQASAAIATDLNNDGRQDIIVANALPGMIWTHENTQRILGQFVRPVGRQAVNSKTPLSAQGMFFVKDYVPGNDIDDFQKSERGEEAMGANSVFLNMGDNDGDGVPEWKDVSKETGLEGSRTTVGLISMDVDLDGDLDIFESNVMDPDYWPGGSTAHAGAANCLYINQLAETGELTFVDKAGEMNVDGLYDADNPQPDYYRMKKYPVIPESYSAGLFQFESYKTDWLNINGEECEPGQISWASVAQDVNDDGYPDIWVANDLGYLRLYINDEGKGFTENKDHARSTTTGYWMSLSPGDFNNDNKEDLFAGNIGGAAYNLAMPIPDLLSVFDPVITSGTMFQQWVSGKHVSSHALIDGNDVSSEMKNKVVHSKILPPDASMPNNIRVMPAGTVQPRFDPESIDPYEFTWGSTTVDIQNDGREDLYWIGCLYGRGGGIFPIMGTGPGRLLINATDQPDELRFVDLTAEHHLFNIEELDYSKLETEGVISRKSPLQNWGKRSVCTSADVSVWGFQGAGVVDKITNHDLIQCAENGRSTVSADLNSDGFPDILVSNMGGYDSRHSNSRNLKGMVQGKPRVIPAHDANYPSPTNYEPGHTRFFRNTYSGNKWIKIDLLDDSQASLNRDAIGAKVLVNKKFMKIKRSGNGGFLSNYFGPILFGLNQEAATTIEIHWPDKARTVTQLDLPEYSNGTLTISKTKGIVNWVETPPTNTL